jgi:hypothetical protein
MLIYMVEAAKQLIGKAVLEPVSSLVQQRETPHPGLSL